MLGTSYVAGVDVYLDSGTVHQGVQVRLDALDGLVQVVLGVLVLHVTDREVQLAVGGEIYFILVLGDVVR